MRRSLGLGKRDKIHYTIRPNGEVILSRAQATEADDPVLGQFLSFLSRDMASHPECLQALDTDFVLRLQSLTRDIDVDLNAPLSAADE